MATNKKSTKSKKNAASKKTAMKKNKSGKPKAEPTVMAAEAAPVTDETVKKAAH